MKTRIGSYYRTEFLKYLRKNLVFGQVLDVGCYDGDFLQTLKADLKVGVDLELLPCNSDVQYIHADGFRLPFEDDFFDFIFALDVIEHVEDDCEFVNSLLRVLATNGRLIMTTPSRGIRINPFFLTNWVSKKWGHHLRKGYTPLEIEELFRHSSVKIDIKPWSAPVWRFFYLFLRLIFTFSPNLIMHLLPHIVRLDGKYQNNHRGYYVIEVTKIN